MQIWIKVVWKKTFEKFIIYMKFGIKNTLNFNLILCGVNQHILLGDIHNKKKVEKNRIENLKVQIYLFMKNA